MRIVSFFAGCGGLDLGFEQAGFDVVWANDLEPSVCDTYVLNHPNTEFVLGDITKVNPESIPDCDGFIGGPPCQSWSVAGRQNGLNDKRGQLFLTYIELIRTKRPKFFLIENVTGLISGTFSEVFDMFIDKLGVSGYEVKWKQLDSVHFGVPQNRERVFIIGIRNDLNISYEFPNTITSEPISLYRAIGDITEEPVRYTGKGLIVPNQVRLNHDVLITPFSSFYNRGNRRRGWSQPSFTIHATADNIPLHPSSPKMMYYGYENWNFQNERLSEYRRLSVRECARIQTFPDYFNFVTKDIKAAYKMIGNAVPPRLGKALAISILSAFQKLSCEKPPMHEKNILDEFTLVGYYKNTIQHANIISNRIYYVRSDGRPGSVFKEDCDMIPRFLFLHHLDRVEILELDGEEPVLADSSFLRTLGFECTGSMYLCFRLKNGNPIKIQELVGKSSKYLFDKKNYAPYFTTLRELLK